MPPLYYEFGTGKGGSAKSWGCKKCYTEYCRILNNKKKEFTVFVKAGVGIHYGLTAMFEALDLKKAKRTKGVIKMGDTSFGYLSKILKNEWENDEFFQPFYDALKE